MTRLRNAAPTQHATKDFARTKETKKENAPGGKDNDVDERTKNETRHTKHRLYAGYRTRAYSSLPCDNILVFSSSLFRARTLLSLPLALALDATM